MLSVHFLIHYFLILGSESLALKNGTQDHLIYHRLTFSYAYL